MNEPPPTIRDALVRAAEALGEALERDPRLREAVRDLAEAWRRLPRAGGAATPEPDPARDGDIEASPDDDARGQWGSSTAGSADDARSDSPLAGRGFPADTAPAPEPASPEQLDELVAAFSGEGAREPTAPAEPRRWESRPASARLIAERCRLKQRACEQVAELAESPERASTAREDTEALIRQAKALEDCYLWMLRTDARDWVAPEKWETLGHTFGNLARAMALADAAGGEGPDPDRQEIEGILALAAEAQRATREAVAPCVAPGRNFEDSDQLAAFRWLAERCETLRIFIERHMKLDDPADPNDWESLLDRITAAEKRRKSLLENTRAENQLRGKVRYEANRLRDAPAAEIDERTHKIAGAIDELVALGMPPSDTGVRELLVPVFDQLAEAPDFEIDAYRLVLRELDRHVARREADEGPAANRGRDEGGSETPEVARVREWLRGRAAVLIGGDERPGAARRLEEAFALSELVWLPTRPHESLESLEPPILRDEVAVVLLAIRWSSHSFAGVRAFCEAAGKPLVRLPGGYGVNRVAAEIVTQASQALSGESAD